MLKICVNIADDHLLSILAMLFNSYIFIFGFLPVSFIVFFSLNYFRLIQLSLLWLTLSSFVFYSYWNLFPTEGLSATPQYLLLIIFSILFNFQLGRLISLTHNTPRSKILLVLGVTINLLLIGYFKYANFFVTSINGVFKASLPFENIGLPLAISFYTFTQIAYLVDAYRGEMKDKNYSFLNYSLFVLFFPHLIAGPIVRHNELIPQLKKLKVFFFNHKNFAIGTALFSIGLSKKVLIADNISPWVAAIFNHVTQLTFLEAWFGAISYTLQLYFDFSGYSDMAIGLGLMFNIRLPINFDSPYKSLSISDFWRRWHISLSNFLRDYLYISLGGNRRGELRRYTNLLITMLLGGLWHGAGWTFVIWGGLHGIYLAINHAWRKLNFALPRFVAWIITFIAVMMSWVVFRAKSLQDSWLMIQTMLGFQGITFPGSPQGKLNFLIHLGIPIQGWESFNYIPAVLGKKSLSLLWLVVLLIGVTWFPNSQNIVDNHKPKWYWALGLALIASISLLSLNRVSEFLYFQF